MLPDRAADVVAAGPGRPRLQHLRRAAARRRHAGDRGHRADHPKAACGPVAAPSTRSTSSSSPPASRPTTSSGRWRSRAATGSGIEELWAKDGARAYLGTMLPGFPNFFMIYGPNTNPIGGLQVVDMEEMVTRFALQCIGHLIQKDLHVGRRHRRRLLALQRRTRPGRGIRRTTTTREPTTTTRTSSAARPPTCPSTPGCRGRCCAARTARGPRVTTGSCRNGWPRSTTSPGRTSAPT